MSNVSFPKAASISIVTVLCPLLVWAGLYFNSAPVFSPSFIKSDTVSLNKSSFKDSASVKRLIDNIFDHKEQDPQNAIKLSTYALNRATDLKNDQLRGGALNVLATIYEDLGDYQLALKYHYQALRLFEKVNFRYGTAMVTGNIGRVYMEFGKLNDALVYLKKAEILAKATNQNKVLLYVYTNFANTYTQLGDFKKGLAYGFKSDSINVDPQIKMVQARNDGNIGAMYFYLKDYPNATRFYHRAMSIALQAKDSITYFMQKINIGEVYEIDHRGDALPGYKAALNYFKRIKDYNSIQYVANDIAQYYKSRGKFEQALNYYQQSVNANQQNTDLQAAKNMSLLQTQYETEKKIQQIDLLNKENTIQKLSINKRNTGIGIITSLLILSAVFGALVYNRTKLKQKNELQQQQMEQQIVLTQAVIEAEERERKRIGSDLHDGVGQLFSAVKMNLNGLIDRVKMDREEDRFLAEKTMALVEESCKEVRVISHQMMPNALLRSGIASDVKSFIDKIDSESLKVNVEANGFKDKIESNVETVLYRVIQESVNNVIKHAKASKLDIILNRDENGISVVISDNGIGFDTSMKDDFAGIGLKNIATRIEYLKGTILYLSSPGKGTSVSIWVPVA